jgi:hypothetical protein
MYVRVKTENPTYCTINNAYDSTFINRVKTTCDAKSHPNLATPQGLRWLDTYAGKRWLTTRAGFNWLETPDGMKWLFPTI